MSKKGRVLEHQKDIFVVDPRNIWNCSQNHPELVVNDCYNYGLTIQDCRIVRQSLLVRGVNKWFKVRRDLIAYKTQIRNAIKSLQMEILVLKAEMTHLYCSKGQVLSGDKTVYDLEAYYRQRILYQCAKERLKTLTSVRGTLKKLCMTDRWQVWEGKRIKDMNTLKASDVPVI